MKSCSWETCQVLPPTRDIKDGAGDVGGLVRDQPDDGVGDFIRGTDALHRHVGCKAMGAIGLAPEAWISVSIRPGLIPATRMPSPATSWPRPTVKVSIAPFEAA